MEVIHWFQYQPKHYHVILNLTTTNKCNLTASIPFDFTSRLRLKMKYETKTGLLLHGATSDFGFIDSRFKTTDIQFKIRALDFEFEVLTTTP